MVTVQPDPSGASEAWKRWRDWIDDSQREIQNLVFYDAVFRMSIAAMDLWPRTRRNFVFGWQLAMYSRDVAVGIRRSMDRTSHTRSFIRLLEEMARTPGEVTRERFVASYPEGLRSAGLEEFDKLTGSEAGVLERRHVLESISMLDAAWSQSGLKEVTNTAIVHSRKLEPDAIPTWQQVHDFVALLEQQCLHYTFLLRQYTRRTLLPANMEDVEEEVARFWLGESKYERGALLRSLRPPG